MKKKRNEGAMLLVIKKWILGLLLGFCLAILLCLCLPKVFGMKVGVVKSGSMEPSIATGSVVYVRPDHLEKIQAGDVIAFRKGTVTVIHRVVRLDESKKGYVTKGDNNEIEDASPVPFSQVIGKVLFHIPYVGCFSVWIEENRLFLLCMFFCFLCAMLLKETVGVKFKRKHRNNNIHEIEQMSYIK